MTGPSRTHVHTTELRGDDAVKTRQLVGHSAESMLRRGGFVRLLRWPIVVHYSWETRAEGVTAGLIHHSRTEYSSS